MSRAAKVLFLVAFLALVATFAVQIMTGGWFNINSVLLGVVGASVVAAIFVDWKLYWEFLTMRTTKHGMNMGLLIILVVTILVCLNYLANKHNKTWDLTREKLNSLSDQSTKVLSSLNKDLEVRIFYKGPAAQDEKARIKQSLNLYQESSGKFKVQFVNAYVQQQEALRYLMDQPDRDTAAVIGFVEYGGKKVRIDEPFDEAAITSALIRVTREGESKIYFIKGHGERDIVSEEDQGLKEFVKSLGEASFKVEDLNLIDKKEIPADAAVVAIVGPSVPYLESEIQWLRAYVQKGGRLFVALDPGQRQNLANLTKPLGIEFENNYVLTLAPMVGGGPATILGRTFDAGSDITKSIPSGSSFTVFPLASEVRPAPDKAPGIEVKELVKSDQYAFTVVDPTKPLHAKPETKAITVGVSAKGTLAKVEEKAKDKDKATEGKPFEAVVFGDSDFISNRGLMLGSNRDLAMNAFAQLANQKDLLSIRPKMANGTIVTLTGSQRLIVILLGLSLPVLLLITSGVMWFRRRGA